MTAAPSCHSINSCNDEEESRLLLSSYLMRWSNTPLAAPLQLHQFTVMMRRSGAYLLLLLLSSVSWPNYLTNRHVFYCLHQKRKYVLINRSVIFSLNTCTVISADVSCTNTENSIIAHTSSDCWVTEMFGTEVKEREFLMMFSINRCVRKNKELPEASRYFTGGGGKHEYRPY